MHDRTRKKLQTSGDPVDRRILLHGAVGWNQPDPCCGSRKKAKKIFCPLTIDGGPAVWDVKSARADRSVSDTLVQMQQSVCQPVLVLVHFHVEA